MKIAVGYLRCSTNMQDQSIGQQKKAIEEWANTHLFKVIEWFEDEGKSGTDFEKRPAFQKLKRRVENTPNFEAVLVYDESRWGRSGNLKESDYWKFHFEKHKVNVRIINSQSRQENDIGSRVVELVEGAEASEYSRKLSRSTLRGCVDNASKGFSNGGTAPYGYRRVAVDPNTNRIIRSLLQGEHRRKGEEKVVWNLGESSEVKTVRKIFDMKCSGYGYRAIADMLNKQGVECPKRGRWRNLNQRWSAGTIQSIITNPAYCGDRAYNRHPLSKKRISETNILGATKERWISTESEWYIQRGAHPSIVGREIFNTANGSRKVARKMNQHIYESPYLLSGLVKCDRCGFNFQGQSYRSQKIYYYVDGGNMNKGKSVCDRLSIRKEKLESYVLELIRESLPTSNVVSKLEDMISQFLAHRSNFNSELVGIEKRISENDQKIQNVLAVVEKGVELDTVMDRLKGLEREKKRLQEDKRKLLKVAGEKLDEKRAAESGAEFVRNFDQRFRDGTIQEQKEMLRQLVLGVRVNPDQKFAMCAITRIPMVNRALTALVNPSEFLNSGHLVGAHCSGGRT